MKKPNHAKEGLHPRNPHRAPYDFPSLVQCCPDLEPFLRQHPLAGTTLDFSDPAAVKTLNRALLKCHYGVAHWDVPPGYLCPPIPSRADYLHYAADLLSEGIDTAIPRGPTVSVLDLGTGANCIYPLLGVHEYGWHFVGTDIDPASVQWAQKLVAANPGCRGKIECRLQPATDALFKHVTKPGETFSLSLCNPPFHASAAEAKAGTLRKLRNLGGRKPNAAVLNFGGQGHELWCPGGETAFVRRMIEESAAFPDLCVWFTTLVAKSDHLPAIELALRKARVREVKIIVMSAGQKKSRIVAWTFLSADQRHERLGLGKQSITPTRKAAPAP